MKIKLFLLLIVYVFNSYIAYAADKPKASLQESVVDKSKKTCKQELYFQHYKDALYNACLYSESFGNLKATLLNNIARSLVKYSQQDIEDRVESFLINESPSDISILYDKLAEGDVLRIHNRVKDNLVVDILETIAAHLTNLRPQSVSSHEKSKGITLHELTEMLHKELERDPNFIGPEKNMEVETYIGLYLKQTENSEIKRLYGKVTSVDLQYVQQTLGQKFSHPVRQSHKDLAQDLMQRWYHKQLNYRNPCTQAAEQRAQDRTKQLECQKRKK